MVIKTLFQLDWGFGRDQSFRLAVNTQPYGQNYINFGLTELSSWLKIIILNFLDIFESSANPFKARQTTNLWASFMDFACENFKPPKIDWPFLHNHSLKFIQIGVEVTINIPSWILLECELELSLYWLIVKNRNMKWTI